MTDTEAPTLEQRVAALEALAIPALDAPDWTDEQIAEFQRHWDETVGQHGVHHGVKWLPPGRALLTPELARELLRECVTVVKPGETLVIRAPDWWSPGNLDEYQRWLNMITDGEFKAFVLAGEEFAVAARSEKPACDCDPAQGEACSGCPER